MKYRLNALKKSNKGRRPALLFIVAFAALPVFLFMIAACGVLGNEDTKDRITKEEGSPGPADGEGQARLISGEQDVSISERGTWRIEFTTGEGGIMTGGGIVLQVSPFWGWSAPQNIYMEYPGYTTISCDRENVNFDVQTGQFNWIAFRLQEGTLHSGDKAVIVYGDTSEGRHPNAAATADKFAERESEFVIKVDADGDEKFKEIKEQPSVKVAPGPPAFIYSALPVMASPDRPVKLHVSALDRRHNLAENFEGRINFTWQPPEKYLPEGCILTSEDRGATAVSLKFKSPGIYRVDMKSEKGDLKGRSNPVLITNDYGNRQVLWADIHGHSNFSDGTGIPEDYFRYARDAAGLDVTALTDHDAFGVRRLASSPKYWNRILDTVEKFHEPGRFVCFPAYEWTSWKYGHKHVLFLSRPSRIFSSDDPKYDSPEELWDALPQGKAITISHHPGGGPIAADWSYHDPQYEPLVEISSIHGNSEFYGCEGMLHKPVRGSFVTDALNKGRKMGILASGDTHNGHPGMGDPFSPWNGTAGIWAESITREGVWSALLKKNVYGTSGPRVFLYAEAEGLPMGSEISLDGEKLNIAGAALAPERISFVRLIKNGKEFLYERGSEGLVRFSFVTEKAGPGDYFYIRCELADGNRAWSSPFWIMQQL